MVHQAPHWRGFRSAAASDRRGRRRHGRLYDLRRLSRVLSEVTLAVRLLRGREQGRAVSLEPVIHCKHGELQTCGHTDLVEYVR